MRPRAKFTIDSLQEIVYEKSAGTKMNDLDLCLIIIIIIIMIVIIIIVIIMSLIYRCLRIIQER